MFRTHLTTFWVFALAAVTASAQSPGRSLEQEARAQAEVIEASIRDGNLERCAAAFDVDALLARLTANVDAPADVQKGFVRGARQGNPGQRFCQDASRSILKLVRMVSTGGEPRALFRVIDENSGVNYLEFYFARDPKGKLNVADVYAYASGEKWSDAIRRLYIQAVAGVDRTFLDKLRGKERESAKGFAELQSYVELVQKGELARALQAYEGLPASLKSEKSVLLLRIKVATAAGDNNAYLEALSDLERNYPGDPALDLMRMDALFLKKRFDELRAVIRRLNERVGPDAHLEFLSASSYIEEGNLTEARRRLDVAFQLEPSLPEIHWGYVTVSLHQKDFKEIVRLLGKIENELGIDVGDLEQNEAYSEFVKSKEYARWKAQRKGK